MDPDRRSRATVVNFAPHLGTATWRYEAMAKMLMNMPMPKEEIVGEFRPSAASEMIVSSIAFKKDALVTVRFAQEFISTHLTEEEQAKAELDLLALLKTVGAVSIKTTVLKSTPAIQTFFVDYDIQIEGNEVVFENAKYSFFNNAAVTYSKVNGGTEIVIK